MKGEECDDDIVIYLSGCITNIFFSVDEEPKFSLSGLLSWGNTIRQIWVIGSST